jgi:hypothetical protein
MHVTALHLNISIDHDIIDGAPLARFAERFKKILLDGRALPARTAEPHKIVPASVRVSAGECAPYFGRSATDIRECVETDQRANHGYDRHEA